MLIDIIILSNGKSEALRKVTEDCIESVHNSEAEIKFNVLVLEQSDITYSNATTIKREAPFNYNEYMNYGVSVTSNNYVCLCNNDLIFEKGWATNIIAAMNKHELLSASPLCTIAQGHRFPQDGRVHFGYRNRWEMSGWCIMTNRKLYDIIGKIDEDFKFWFADNAYTEQLQKFGVKHALVSNSIVRHLGSKTLQTLDREEHNAFTTALIPPFCQKHPKNESAIHFSKRVK